MGETTLSWNEMRERACAFVVEWKGEKSERAEAQSFWSDWAVAAARYDLRLSRRPCALHTRQLQLRRAV